VKPKERRYLYRLLGESAQGRGRVSEASLLDAVIAVGAELEWFVSARKADASEDERGIDIAVIVHGREEPLYLQAKSSFGKAKSFASKRRDIHIEVVVVSLNDELTRVRAREALENAYAKTTVDVEAVGGSRISQCEVERIS